MKASSKTLIGSLSTALIVICTMAASLLVSVSPAVASFGFSSVGFSATEQPTPEQEAKGELGVPDTQAGSHPWQVTASFLFNTRTNTEGETRSVEDVKDVFVELPPGLVGNATVLQQCTGEEFGTRPSPPEALDEAGCSPTAQVGVANVRLWNTINLINQWYHVYNLVPPPGAPAAFGINPASYPVLFRPTVRTSSDYGLTLAARNISQFLPIGGSRVTFWGVPADRSHDAFRGKCLGFQFGEFLVPHQVESPVGSGEFVDQTCPDGESPKPFLTLPEQCAESLPVVFHADSWEHPGAYNPDGGPDYSDPNWVRGETRMPRLQGCADAAFAPTLSAAADTSAADTPAGLTVEVKDAQDGLLNPVGVAAAAIGESTVTLPAGVSINPGQAAGLRACQPDQDGIGSEDLPSCPAASKVGTVQITSPLLRDSLEGDVYVLQSNPPNVQLLIAASADGVNVKLLANVHLNEATGQLTTTLSNLPPLPVSDFKLSFSGGAQAALVTPPTCGSYTTNALFVPSSAPFGAAFPSSSALAIGMGPGGSACAAPLPFAPSMTAGSTTDQAGGYTSFSMLLQRGDGSQRISSLRFQTPKGLEAVLRGVPLCGEPQAAQGVCPASSQIGHTIVTAGPGPAPLVVPQPGQAPAPIYLTEGYKGAPYGLSIAVPVVAGPFNLGTVVVRATIVVDPRTAQLTITTDPLPSILDGIPTDLRTIDAVIDRPRFMFNPTNCAPQAFTGTALSTAGVEAALSYRFQVGSCQSLPFTPDFKVTTAGKTSKKDGTSLDAKVIYPAVPVPGNQAETESNIAFVKVDLPKQMPSRLSTLQQACLARVFEADPANCPVGSVVGHAAAVTPVLPVPLTGPAYFVSHGGEAFPSLIVVLQGYGVTVELEAETFINKVTGVTSSTFRQVPDVPFTSFDLDLPAGPSSALGTNLPARDRYDMCGQTLMMPTRFIAQNGAEIRQNTKIGITGCQEAAKARNVRKAKAHKQVKATDRRSQR